METLENAQMTFREKAAWLALGVIFGFEPTAAAHLVEQLGSAEAAFNLSKKEQWKLLGIRRTSKIAQLEPATLDKAEQQLDELGSMGCSFVCMCEKGYPPLLRECPDAPLGLYLKSNSSSEEIFLSGRPMIAVVGTRDISHYGREWCEKLVSSLAACKEKPTIVSGLALGTDITAHCTALDGGLPTVAVMATGIDRIFPSQHEWQADRMCVAPDSGLITDYPPRTGALPVNFVRRNRIIAGICAATLLVESKIKGGGMITARLAASYNREVYALPGRADDLRSQGCNQLIREHLADAVTDPQSFLAQLGLNGRVRIPGPEDLWSEVSGNYKNLGETGRKLARIALDVRKKRGITIEELARECHLPVGETTSLCYLLQSDGYLTIGLMGDCSISRKKT